MNRLSAEVSPYLLQHKNNPVWWHAWGDEAFCLAKEQNKPVFLSIGYSSCYWCHVMEHESFENDDVAALLNQEFISIKVDREERPDIDAIYMDAVVGLTGHGGWPMSVFLTPDRKPFWGGTYFPRQQFISILRQLARAWHDDHRKVIDSSNEIAEALAGRRLMPVNDLPATRELFAHAAEFFGQRFDSRYGGFGPAPKFPPSQQIRFLMRAYRAFGTEEPKAMALSTLEYMAAGGLFDQLGGGFARYSTDEKWLVPHFEKMLYDNALLVVTYLEAYELTKQESFAAIAREALDYILNSLISPEGGFWSAQDAGEVGKEGEYYLWEYDELQKVLSPEQLALARQTFSVTEGGNFEHKNILTRVDLTRSSECLPLIDGLLALRQKRSPPPTDTKILTDWNGLAVSAFVIGAQVLQEPRYLDAAKRAMEFVLHALSRGEKLLHRYAAGKAAIEGMVDDYAFVIQALIDLHGATKDARYLSAAEKFQAFLDREFWETGSGYVTSIAKDVIHRKVELVDGATPSGNGVSARNLARLHKLSTARFKEYRNRSFDVVRCAGEGLVRSPGAFPSMLLALDLLEGGAQNVCDQYGCALPIQFSSDSME